MANVYVENIGVPRKARNGRIYGANTFDSINPYSSGKQDVKHWEHGQIKEITDNPVIVYFTVPFTNTPTLVNLKVFRMVENIPTAGKWIKQDVLHYFDDDEDWFIKSGFSLFIDSSEPLTGVIVEYCFTE